MQLFRPVYRTEEIIQEIRKVLETGWTGTGPHCKAFEEEWNEFIGCKYSHFVNSCTAALHLAVRLLDLPPGSKIVTTPITFVSTNAVILYENHEPVFADIDPNTLSLDPEDVKRKISYYNADAVIWVHYGGQVHPGFEEFSEWAEKHNIPIIEDCAHAAGAYYNDGVTRVGNSTNSICCFSYQTVKNLPTFDAGMIVVPNEEMLERVKRLSWMGIDRDTFARTNGSGNEIYKWQYDIPELGWKYNGNDVAAAVARTQLKYLDHDNAYRLQLNIWYRRHLDVPIVAFYEWASHHLFVIKVDNRDEVISTLKANGVAPGVHYLPNMFFQPFKEFYEEGDCPHAENMAQKIVSLPNHLQMKAIDVERITEVVNETAKY